MSGTPEVAAQAENISQNTCPYKFLESHLRLLKNGTGTQNLSTLSTTFWHGTPNFHHEWNGSKLNAASVPEICGLSRLPPISAPQNHVMLNAKRCHSWSVVIKFESSCIPQSNFQNGQRIFWKHISWTQNRKSPKMFRLCLPVLIFIELSKRWKLCKTYGLKNQ